MANYTLLIFVLCASVFCEEDQQTLYVSVSDGSDFNSCNTTNPCASLNGALSKVNSPLVMIYISEGEYVGINNTGITFPNASFALIGEEGVSFDCQNDITTAFCFNVSRDFAIENIDISNCMAGILATGQDASFVGSDFSLTNIFNYGVRMDAPYQFTLRSSNLFTVPNGIVVGSPPNPAFQVTVDQSRLEDSSCFFNANKVSVANSIFTKSNVNVYGVNSTDYIEEPNSVFDSCVFTSTEDSALSVTNGHLIVQNSTFSECVSNNGGAIFAAGALSVLITDVSFEGNNATNGGAIDLVSSTYSANITNAVFSGNNATVGSVLACCVDETAAECSIQIILNNVDFTDGNSENDIACPIVASATPSNTPTPSVTPSVTQTTTPTLAPSTTNSTNWGLIIGSIVGVLAALFCIALIIGGIVFFYIKKRKANYDEI